MVDVLIIRNWKTSVKFQKLWKNDEPRWDNNVTTFSVRSFSSFQRDDVIFYCD